MTRPKVFGIGLNKTGTTTLSDCLLQLGYRHMSNRKDLLIRFREQDLEPIFSVIDAHDSFEDWPWPLMYREIFARYGDQARYVLTKRSTAAVWLESLKKHAVRITPTDHCRLLAYGYNYPHGYEREHIAIYEGHNAGVRDFFRQHGAEHLLLEVCWERSDGWAKLCGFLGDPIPAVAFPHSNAGGTADVPPDFRRENLMNIERQLRELGRHRGNRVA